MAHGITQEYRIAQKTNEAAVRRPLTTRCRYRPSCCHRCREHQRQQGNDLKRRVLSGDGEQPNASDRF